MNEMRNNLLVFLGLLLLPTFETVELLTSPILLLISIPESWLRVETSEVEPVGELLFPIFDIFEPSTFPILFLISVPNSWLGVEETPEVDTGNRTRILLLPIFDKFEPTTFPIVLSITVLERWLVELPELDAGN